MLITEDFQNESQLIKSTMRSLRQRPETQLYSPDRELNIFTTNHIHYEIFKQVGDYINHNNITWIIFIIFIIQCNNLHWFTYLSNQTNINNILYITQMTQLLVIFF